MENSNTWVKYPKLRENRYMAHVDAENLAFVVFLLYSSPMESLSGPSPSLLVR